MNAIPETDLVKIAEREVIDTAKAWARTFARHSISFIRRYETQHELLVAITLLESREQESVLQKAMADTKHLEER